MSATAVDIESLASLPARGPWALRVLVGAIAHYATSGPDGSWPEAPPAVELLARAVAQAKGEWPLWRSSGRRYATEWLLELGPDEPYPEVDVKRTFVLASGEDNFGYAVSWTSRDDEAVTVHWCDFEDGVRRAAGTLEDWCVNLLLDSLFDEQDGERGPGVLFFDSGVVPRLVEFLRMLSRRRAELVDELQRRAAELEASIQRIETEGGDSEAAYGELSVVCERLDLLGPRAPWPTV